MAKKIKTVEYTVADALDNGKCELEELRDEVQEVFDNMPESLQGSDRGQRMEECAQTLDDALSNAEFCDEVANTCRDGDDEKPAAGGITFTWIDGSKKRMSRAARRDEATSKLRGAIDALQEALDEDEDAEEPKYAEQRDEIEQAISDATELADNADGADFPGMYG